MSKKLVLAVLVGLIYAGATTLKAGLEIEKTQISKLQKIQQEQSIVNF